MGPNKGAPRRGTWPWANKGPKKGLAGAASSALSSAGAGEKPDNSEWVKLEVMGDIDDLDIETVKDMLK